MLLLNKGQQNELILNINNNSRTDFTGYTLTFTHVVSQEVKSYTINLSNSAVYAENDRYCEIILNLQNAGQDLNYLGQYNLQIFGNGTNLVYTGMAQLNGSEESNPFTEYVSPDEDNSNYIYIQD
jgi:hypothetical protein